MTRQEVCSWSILCVLFLGLGWLSCKMLVGDLSDSFFGYAGFYYAPCAMLSLLGQSQGFLLFLAGNGVLHQPGQPMSPEIGHESIKKCKAPQAQEDS